MGSKTQFNGELIGYNKLGAQAIHFAGENCKDKFALQPKSLLVVGSKSLDHSKKVCAWGQHAIVVLLEAMAVSRSLLEAHLSLIPRPSDISVVTKFPVSITFCLKYIKYDFCYLQLTFVWHIPYFFNTLIICKYIYMNRFKIEIHF